MAINKTINKRTNTHEAMKKLHRICFVTGQDQRIIYLCNRPVRS